RDGDVSLTAPSRRRQTLVPGRRRSTTARLVKECMGSRHVSKLVTARHRRVSWLASASLGGVTALFVPSCSSELATPPTSGPPSELTTDGEPGVDAAPDAAVPIDARHGGDAEPATAAYANPVFAQDFPDPFILPAALVA
ncbi:MAG TPA: hypothetical protein VM925_26265, partial [Labilithrix sp.]|nr:hypothetical protein [Labilithrix sp.]